MFGLSRVFRKGKPFADTEEKRGMLDRLVGEFARKPRWRMTSDGSVSDRATMAITKNGGLLPCCNGVCHLPGRGGVPWVFKSLEEVYGPIVAYTEGGA